MSSSVLCGARLDFVAPKPTENLFVFRLAMECCSSFGGGAPGAWVPKAKVAANKALELDNTLAEAHSALAIALWSYDYDFDQSRAEFQRAIDLNPNYATAHLWFGTWVLTSLGRFDDAIAEIKRALELDPLSLVNNTDLGNAYMYARRYDAAIDQLRKRVVLDPSFYYAHVVLGQALELKGGFAQAIVECRKVQQLSDDPFILGVLGYAYAAIGKSDETRKILNQLSEMSAQRYVPAYAFTLLHLALGENKDEAIRWFEKNYQDRDWFPAMIKIDPFLDPLRGNPRFEQLVTKVSSGAGAAERKGQ
jgi:tetratricopeptide (TPR) repeat protein